MKEQNIQGIVEIVIPGNDPVKVASSDLIKDPYSTVGILLITFPGKNGAPVSGFGTGTIIGGQYILTCAHNLYQEQYGGNATSVRFIQSYSDPLDPFGPPIDAETFYYPQQYPSFDFSTQDPSAVKQDQLEANISFDYGVVKLKKSVYYLPAPMPQLVVQTDEELQNKSVQINGYGFFGEQMGHASGAITVVGDTYLQYPISTMSGASGSGIVGTDGVSIVGIHTRGVPEKTLNQGVRITQSVLNDVNGWVGQQLVGL